LFCLKLKNSSTSRSSSWAAGVQASPLGRLLAEKTGADVDKEGRLVVQPDLTVAGHPDLFVIGDLAHFEQQDSKPLPGVAAVAMQQGRYVAKLINRRLRGRPSRGETREYSYVRSRTGCSLETIQAAERGFKAEDRCAVTIVAIGLLLERFAGARNHHYLQLWRLAARRVIHSVQLAPSPTPASLRTHTSAQQATRLCSPSRRSFNCRILRNS